jgi:OOP family OmpA-OmpF porin
MKHRIILLSLALLTVNFGYSQKEDIKESKDTGERKDYNKWTIELVAGQSKGIRPFTDGYYSSNTSSNFLAALKMNTFSLGIRYMFSAKFGLKADLSSDKFSNSKITNSKDFELQQYRFGIQGVVNASRLLNIQQELGRLNILIHAGLQAARATPKYQPDENVPGYYYNQSEYNLGVMFGISPEVRISNKFSIIGDFSTLNNFRQNFAWDGNLSERSNNISGQMIMGTIGLTYSLGKDNIHGDWAIIGDDKLKEIDELEQRIGELESMMNDIDKDGVPDYLDAENNSIAGVAVDTKGRMVDINKNGVPDELEKYMADTFVDKANVKQTIESANADMIKSLINDGYVSTYFDVGKTTPTNVSTEGIDFMLTFLRNNPNASIDIIGHADEIGKTTINEKLSIGRANAVKNTLIKAGIPTSRMNIISEGEDTSVAIDSADARKLVRKVTFKIK